MTGNKRNKEPQPLFRQKAFVATFSSSRTGKEKFTSALPRREKVHKMNAQRTLDGRAVLGVLARSGNGANGSK